MIVYPKRGYCCRSIMKKCYLKDTAPAPRLRQLNGHLLKRGKEQKPKHTEPGLCECFVGAKWQARLLGDSMKQRKRSAQASQSVKGLVANE